MWKVKGGTETDTGSKHLCADCKHGTVMQAAAESKQIVYCSAIGEVLKTRIIKCSAYSAISVMSLGEMRQIAWFISNELKEKPGFQHKTTEVKVETPSDRDKDEKYRYGDNVPSPDRRLLRESGDD